MRRIKFFIILLVIAGIFYGGSKLADITAADYEKTRVETLQTNFATWPTNPDGSPMEYPTE